MFLACRGVNDNVDTLYPEELSCIGKAGERRRNTFSTGRLCARAALAEAGLPPSGLPRNSDGSIQWPDGVMGSVSHTNDWAVAAVAIESMSEAACLGIDLERIQPLEEGVMKLIASATEKAELAEAGSQHWHATALFSLKESIYKCLRPSYGRFIEFLDVEISDLAGGRPHVSFTIDSLREHCDPSDLELRMAVTPEHVFSLAWLRQR